MANTALVWIRDDFRIQNNDALTYATNQHDAVTAVFILIVIFSTVEERLKNGG